ncbi:MAG: ATP-binding protein [Pseudomonas sp.]|uniref:AAA family ATPase n=1 Tax=unclassified Pseudomonas TaxID=196821 RepID=UPI0015B6501E|nr:MULTISPECIES: AAA family ATPase [unclassified Pseudomonas]MDN5391546.1 ATP-binding protein [Pseudomonas sp.]MDN5453881.1 ATP-binding protein [Pseudomonas sp.]MDN5457908.1 ATP-binding protein [Pseudomonas sp.]MDN5496578.1 ATP-binding protein [Pseudomonas sp.]MDN5671288.1 ATP-binding protein [Pseudomonas sp.]
MLDERELVGAKVIRDLEALALDCIEVDKYDFFTAALYLIAVRCVDWEASKWIGECLEHDSYNEKKDNLVLAEVLVGYYVRQYGRASVDFSDFSGYDVVERVVSKACASATRDNILFLYDYIFYFVVSSYVKLGRQHPGTIAALVTGLKREMDVVDYFLYFGEAFLPRWNSVRYPQYYFNPNNSTSYQDLVLLRLVVHDIEPVPLDSDLQLPESDLFGVLDILSGSSSVVTSMSQLDELFKNHKLPEKLLVVLEGVNDGSDANLRKRVKEYLYHEDLLEVVIEFTSFDHGGRPKRLTAWLLNKSKLIRYRTLCVNVSHIVDLERGVTTEDAVGFAAALVDLWSSKVKFRAGRYPALMKEPLKVLFARSFGDGSNKILDAKYKDIPAVCKVVSSDVFHKGAVSVARHLAEPVSTYRLLSIEPVISLFIGNPNKCRLIYIIGNNGAGKSLLLSNLVDDLCELEIPVLGVSSGAADRFSSKHRLFKYCGESRLRGRSDKVIARNLLKSLMKIVNATPRGDVFASVMDLVNLKHRLYMVREDLTDEALLRGDNSHLIIELSQANRNLIKEVGVGRDFEPALMREDSNNIVRFKNLSSGEQCIVLMLSKIISSVEPGAVVLVDEPEISLHVHWQQMLPKLFEVISNKLECSFVVATHSPTVVANVGGEESYCFLANKGFLTPIPPEQRHSVETILLEGFKVYTPHNREVHERCAALVSQAIRAVNAPGNLDLDQKRGMLDELNDMTGIINSSGNEQEVRSQQDISLVEQAKLAIDEIYDLAGKEL